jgi:hypothetical protein
VTGVPERFMTDTKPIEARIYDHVVGTGCPIPTLLNTGVLQSDWADAYLVLLQEARRTWQDQPKWPRELVTAIHVASWYLHIRYDSWSGFQKKRNEETEHSLGRIRFSSESFLMSPISDLNRVIEDHATARPTPNDAAPPPSEGREMKAWSIQHFSTMPLPRFTTGNHKTNRLCFAHYLIC